MSSADVFGRTGTGAGRATRIDAAVGGQHFLEFQHVLPVVAEVVTVSNWIDAVSQEPRDRNVPTSEMRFTGRHLIIRDADAPCSPRLRIDHDEFVKVVVL